MAAQKIAPSRLIPSPTPMTLLPRQISAVQHAGHSALKLSTRYGSATLALQGAQLLSWQPTGEREVFWLSPTCLPEPAAIRGGVPICWPWFAKQGQAASATQHGPVRNLRWQLSVIHACSDEEIHLSFEPSDQLGAPVQAAHWPGVPAGLRVRLELRLGEALVQTLLTHNLGKETFVLSQALHSYYACSNACSVKLEGLQGLAFTDRLRDLAQDVQLGAFALDHACDRTYEHPPSPGVSARQRYELVDAAWQRSIMIDVQGSRSVVVWNPGHEAASRMLDVPDDGWRDFMCIEAANAGGDVVALEPGGTHQLTQTLSVLKSATKNG
jgi:glucose-6-phosphate 1-epimerase